MAYRLMPSVLVLGPGPEGAELRALGVVGSKWQELAEVVER